MTLEEIRQWTREHHFPFLVLPGGYQRHGEAKWSETLEVKDEERTGQIVKRIEEWKARVEKVS